MRKIIFLLIIILTLPTTLWGADQIIGTWKLNTEKSTYPHKELTEIYKEIGKDQIELTRTGHGQGFKFHDNKYTFPRQGGVCEFNGRKIGVEIKVSDGEWYAVNIDDEKEEWWIIHKIISEDGKTMYQESKRFEPQGNLVVEKGVFDRQ